MRRWLPVILGSMLLVTGCGGEERVCLRSHVEVTPAHIAYEPRITTGPGASVGTGGGIGIGSGTGRSGSVDYGPVMKPEHRVVVCDAWATPEGD